MCEKKAEQVAKTLLTENTYTGSKKESRGTFYSFVGGEGGTKELEINEMQSNYEMELKYR